MSFHWNSFHTNCGKRITLSNNNNTATRSFNEFNHGLVLSATPLEDNVLFEVRIDQKVILIFRVGFWKYFFFDFINKYAYRCRHGVEVLKLE